LPGLNGGLPSHAAFSVPGDIAEYIVSATILFSLASNVFLSNINFSLSNKV